MQELPVIGEEPRERADAARNRSLVLEAAARLFAERGPGAVSMDEIALAAGVGKGTLFRRFGDRSGLVRELLSEHEARFQEAFLRGPAPLGPGASPIERLCAFGREKLAMLEENYEFVLDAERASSACARFRFPVYTMYRAHITRLVAEVDPGLDADYVADLLLEGLTAEFFSYQRVIREMPLERIQEGWERLVWRLVPPPG